MRMCSMIALVGGSRSENRGRPGACARTSPRQFPPDSRYLTQPVTVGAKPLGLAIRGIRRRLLHHRLRRGPRRQPPGQIRASRDSRSSYASGSGFRNRPASAGGHAGDQLMQSSFAGARAGRVDRLVQARFRHLDEGNHRLGAARPFGPRIVGHVANKAGLAVTCQGSTNASDKALPAARRCACGRQEIHRGPCHGGQVDFELYAVNRGLARARVRLYRRLLP